MVKPSTVKQELAFDGASLGLSESLFDSLLHSLIRRETERVADAIDIALGVETTTETMARPVSVNGWQLPIPERPIQSVNSVSINTDLAPGNDVTASDYIVHDTHLELDPTQNNRTSWPTERRSITVEWSHGYPDGDEPAPINGAIIGLVRHALQEIESDGVTSESIDGQTADYELGETVVTRHLMRARRFDKPNFYDGASVV